MELTPNKPAWVKFGKIKKLSFFGKEYICIASGCHMLFINTTTGAEAVYHADNRAVGEGVRTFTGHKTLPYFAFAERCRFPRVFILICPSFKKICILSKGTNEDFLAISFSAGGYILTLNNTPSFMVIMWKWRTGERITSMQSNIYGAFQILSAVAFGQQVFNENLPLNLSGTYNNFTFTFVEPPTLQNAVKVEWIRCNYMQFPIHYAQLQTGHTKLCIWDFMVCGKKYVLSPRRIQPPKHSAVFTDCLWTTENTLFVLDILGNVYMIDSKDEYIRIIESDGEGRTIPSFCWFKAGLTMSVPNGNIKHFRKAGDWSCHWQATPDVPLKRICSNNKDTLVGVSEDGELMAYNFEENEFKFLIRYQSKFNDLCLIYPMGEYFVTLQHKHEVTAWEVATGKMRGMKILKGTALAIKENPEYPYVGVAYEHGVLELLSIHNPDEIITMTSFNLSKRPLNSVYFTEVGKLIVAANMDYGEFFVIEGIPGSKMEIIATVEAHRQICDYILVASRTCLRLFALYVTSNLYIAGNRLVRFCIIRGKIGVQSKEYTFDSRHQMYSRLYATTSFSRDRVFLAVPLTTKCIHEVTTKRGDSIARVTNVIETGHQMKKINIHTDKHHAITYAYDGLVIIRSTDFKKRIAVVMPQYRTAGGVKKAYVSPLTKYVVSLGRDHALVGTMLTKVDIDTDLQQQLNELINSPRFVLMFKRQTIGFSPTGEFEGITWFEMEKIRQQRRECAQWASERSDIVKEFLEIQEELQSLFTENLEGPENEKLDIQEFNLDVNLKQEKINKSKETCKYTQIYLQALIAANDKVCNWIKGYCWDNMREQGQEIRGLFSDFTVNNYVLLPRNREGEKFLNCITVYRRLESQMGQNDMFEPWIPKTESKLKLQLESPPSIAGEKGPRLGFLEDEEQVDEEIVDRETETAFKGSVTHEFVELIPDQYSQMEVSSFLQAQFNSAYCLLEVLKLKEHFNVLFDEMMNQKIKEMSLIHERIARLRYIITEMNYFSVNKISILIDDPQWTPLENPDSVLKAEDREVGITPYISPSEQAMLNALAAEEERIRLMLLADDFRERALIAMMNGVLEVRWEEELKKDVPKPKCMLEKSPEDFSEDDLRIVAQYEEDVKFLNSERDRYKKLLELEYGKLSNTVRDSIKKFNKRLRDFLMIKIQTDSGIRQENMKLSRIRVKHLKRILSAKREEEIIKEIARNQKKVQVTQCLLVSLDTAFQDLKDNAEILQAKDKQLEKAFKKDFTDASPFVQEQSTKLYKKRPRVSVRNITSATLVLEIAKCVTSSKRTLLLTQECLEYLKSLNVLDQYINIPPAIDENLYETICKLRRIKIESELRIKASNLEIAEAENTIRTYQKLLQSRKDHGQQLSTDLDQVRSDRLLLMHDIDLQLILKKGIVELPTNGLVSDYDDAVMVNRKDVETINKIIVKGGERKLKAMKETMTFRRGILATEWEHRGLNMKIDDLHGYIEDIQSVKVTKEIQAYLKGRAKGFSQEVTSFEEEADLIRGCYRTLIDDKKNRTMELQARITKLVRQSTGPGSESLTEIVKNSNIDVCEYLLLKDNKLEKKALYANKIRMETVVKRGQLIRQIQKNHAEILLLQTELEIKRSKTYPTFSYTILP